MNRQTFWILIALMALGLIVLRPIAGSAKVPKKPLKCVAPSYLKPGDKVALISPSYYCSMETAFRAADTLRSWGYEPVIGPNVGKKYLEHYAGTVEERLADLRWALADPDIKAIICLRGGYSTLHLVEGLPLKELAASPKWLIGYSDITTLLSMEACAGVMSIHGVMGCNITGSGSIHGEQSRMLLRDLLKGQVPRYELPAHKENILGRASGTLVGGNLATFAPLLGTQADAIGKTDIILFVEEVEETYHNIDRLFNMLKMSGVLAHCKGIILGDFTDCKNDVGYESVEAMLREYIAPYNIPLLCGFPAGHEKVNLPLVIGAPVTMDVRADGATLSFDIPGKQKTVQPREIIFQYGEFAECLNIQPSKDTFLVKLHWRFIESELMESSLAELDSVLQTVCTESNRFELTYWDYTIAEASSYPGTRRGAFLYQRMESICPNSRVTKMTIKHEIIERYTEKQPGYRVLMICPVRE
ncbi:MAG: LD-carboxypeptidase [Bacteroidales bacterium]|nr:LD-carboxypeptidase [Bacteroidales bacterium]